MKNKEVFCRRNKKDIFILILVLISMSCLTFFLYQVTIKQKEQSADLINQNETLEHLNYEEKIQQDVQVVINEVHRGKEGSEGQNWIELYYTGNSTLSLDGYSLCINRKNLINLPKGVSMKPDSYLVIYDQQDKSNSLALPMNLSFNSTGIVELRRQDMETVDFVNIPFLNYDESYGRTEEQDCEYAIMKSTKLLSNQGAERIMKSYPVFSRTSGFYDEPFKVTIYAANGADVFYTLDGTTPTTMSEKYTEPIVVMDATVNENIYSANSALSMPSSSVPENKVDKATVLQAISVDRTGNISRVSKAVYYVDYSSKSGYEGIPNISIITEPDNLFSYWDGIYVPGATHDRVMASGEKTKIYANFLENRSCDASILYFEPSGIMSYRSNVKLAIYQDDYENNTQKSLLVSNMSISGESESGINSFMSRGERSGSLILSNGQADYLCKTREFLIGQLSSNCHIDCAAMKMVNVFIDGEYWGLYVMEQPIDVNQIVSRYQVNKNNIIIMNQGTIEYGKSEYQRLYDELIYKASQKNLSWEPNYKQVTDLIDIDSLIDYYCIQLIISNRECMKLDCYMWRSINVTDNQYEDGKWRWVLKNTDQTLGLSEMCTYSMNTLVQPEVRADPLLKNLLRNEKFRNKFYNRMLYLVENEFSYDRVHKILNEYISLYRKPAFLFYERYVNGKDTQRYTNYIEIIDTFFLNRWEYLSVYLDQEYAKYQ